MFRFQTGSIKSMDWHERADLLRSSFDSKLVRLKANSQRHAWKPYLCFDSKLVRLKVYATDAWLQNIFSFDSKLVRLKVVY